MSHRIVSRQEWGFSGWNGTPRRANTSDWKYVTFHFDGSVPCLKDTGNAMMRRTHSFHKNGRGWSGVGYNYLVDSKGNIFEGRGLDYRGAHKPSGPGSNTNGIGIQLHLGGNERPTEAMKSAAAWLVAYLEKRVGRTLKRSWHNDGYATSCPGPFVTAWVKGGLKSGSVTTPVDKPSKPTPVEKTKTVVKGWAAKLQGTITGEPRGPFPLPAGHWYGPNDGSSKSHSGYQAKDSGAIKSIQRKVGTGVDGLYGPGTKKAVAAWQRKAGLASDGLVGDKTWRMM